MNLTYTEKYINDKWCSIYQLPFICPGIDTPVILALISVPDKEDTYNISFGLRQDFYIDNGIKNPLQKISDKIQLKYYWGKSGLKTTTDIIEFATELANEFMSYYEINTDENFQKLLDKIGGNYCGVFDESFADKITKLAIEKGFKQRPESDDNKDLTFSKFIYFDKYGYFDIVDRIPNYLNIDKFTTSQLQIELALLGKKKCIVNSTLVPKKSFQNERNYLLNNKPNIIEIGYLELINDAHRLGYDIYVKSKKYPETLLQNIVPEEIKPDTDLLKLFLEYVL